MPPRLFSFLRTVFGPIVQLLTARPSRRPEIDQARSHLLDVWLLMAGVFAAVPVAVGVLRAVRESQPHFAVAYVLTLAVLVVGLASRRRLSYDSRARLLLAALMIWGIASLLRVGLTGMGFTLLISAVVLAAPLRGVRAALALTVLGAASIALIGGAHLTGTLPPDSVAPSVLMQASAWVNGGLLFVALATMLTVSPQLLLGRLEEALDDAEAHAAKLQAAQRAARESENRFRELAELLPETVFEADLEGRFTYLNRVAFSSFGYPEGEVPSGFTVFDTVHPDDRAAVRAAVARLASTQTERGGLNEYRGLRRDGSAFPIIVTTGAIRRDGKLVGVRGLVLDVTEKKAAEERLRQARNLEAVGRLAAGVAHDFNNLLFGIRGRVALMQNKPDRADLPEHLSHVDEYVSSAAHLTRQLLAFGRGGSYEVSEVHLGELVRKASSLFARTQKRLTFGLHLPEQVWAVTADAGQLEQVVLNLLLNAEQAIPATGTVDLTVRNLELSEGRAAALEMKPGDCVCLEVRDTGVGIEPADLARIFEPFFTTKGPGRGTGLGLASAYGVVRAHRGAIEVESRRGEGACFRVTLPASSRQTPQVKKPLAAVSPARGSELVLVVDDEPLVLNVTKPLLERAGYTVLTAASGTEALATMEREQSRIGLVLLDMVMPGMSGAEAFRRLRALRPELRVLLVSGYTDSEEAHALLREEHVGFLAKPYRLDELAAKMREVLGGSAKAA
ncbi:MAG TPA: response regulator [Myxococcales bacterium]|jgi:PAS domain S-box-containing protein